MELYLTLAIAVGGIATGIGAIWTAIVARRQLSEQRQFIREQNERARINLQEDVMNRLWQQWMSPSYEDFRRKSIQFIKENLLVDGDLVEPERMDAATLYVADFFQQVGYLTRIGVLDIERVFVAFYPSIRLGWALWEPAVQKHRAEWGDPMRYADNEYLYHQVLDFDAKRGGTGAPPTKEEVRHFAEWVQQVAVELRPSAWEREPADDQALG